jgi:hypothetical protein
MNALSSGFEDPSSSASNAMNSVLDKLYLRKFEVPSTTRETIKEILR